MNKGMWRLVIGPTLIVDRVSRCDINEMNGCDWINGKNAVWNETADVSTR